MSSQDFIAKLLTGLDEAFQPLEEAVGSVDAFAAFIANFGWTLAVSADLKLFDSISQGLDALDQAIQAIENSSGDDELSNAIKAVVSAIQVLVPAIRALEQTNPASLPSPLDQAVFWQTFPLELLDFLLYKYLKEHVPVLFGSLHFLGIFSEDLVIPTTPGRNPYLSQSIHWERIPESVAQPGKLFADVYGWGGIFDHQRLVANLQKLLESFSLPSILYPPLSDLDDYYDADAIARRLINELRVPLYWALIDDGTGYDLVNLDLVVMPIPPTGSRTADPAGFVLFPELRGQFQAADIKLSDSIELTLSGGFDTKVIRAEIRPDGVNVVASAGDTSLSALAKLNAQPASPWILLGTAKSSRLELGQAHVSLGANGPVTNINYKIEVGADSLKFVLDLGEGDGFLQKLLGGKPQTLDLSTVISWSNKTGFGFSGQAALETNIPVHLSIAGDILSVDTIYIALRAADGNKAALQVALTGGLNIGPVAATVDRVGLQLEVTPRGKTDPPGNLGTLNLGFGFKPPNGLGLLIDAGAVVGGGYIFFDVDKGQYAGVLELKLETIQIKAIGILDTRLPDGSTGFSFLIIITAEFSPIQLGFGFTLIGVGGLAGINRTMVLEALRSGLRNHTLNSILFPPDPIRNAPQIISDLRTIFPPVEGRYVFGPMIEIGWGTPTIISASLGVLLELPSPVRLALLGQIKAVLPTDDAALILLHIDILGIIDFGAKYLSLDGTIYDSRIVVFSLLGDMALRLNWGDNPNFLCSIGGFHPRFQPPAGFPTLHRLMVSIGYGDYIRMSLSSYQAFTSNTVQFGASFDLRVDFAGFRIHGYFSFDALFIFTPFSFIAEMRAGVELSFEGLTLFSIHLDLMLSGPTPWHAHGTASIDILFFSISVSVDITFGDARQVTAPGVSPVQPLLDALNDARNWSAALPEGAEQAVSLTAAKADEKVILMHPMGLLTVRQTVVPLGITITKFGEAAPAEADKLDITSVTFGQSTQNEVAGDEPDYFASAHFFTLSDGQKLAAPSYTQLKAGVKVGAADIKGTDKTNVSNLQLSYDTFIVDDPNVPGAAHDVYSPTLQTMLAHTRQGAAELSLVRATGNAKYVVPGTASAVKLAEPQYVVVSTEDLAVNGDVSPAGGASYFAATVALQAYLAINPEKAGLLQVVPLHEV